MAKKLKLKAEDEEDLRVVSACLQDALIAVGDISYLKDDQRFVLIANRFCWEAAPCDEATDLSPDALAVAGENAARLGVADRLTLLEGSWFAPVTGTFDIILSNPPYIPVGEIAGLAPDVRNFDPTLALSGGADGLGPYRIIASGAASHLGEGGYVLVEIGAGQAADVEAIFAAQGFQTAGRHCDLGGHTRCLGFNRVQK